MQSMSDLWRGINAFKQGKYSEAHVFLEPAAISGSCEACLLLSRMYFAGNGVEQSRDRYAFWLCRAAELGDPAARAKIKRMLRSNTLPTAVKEDVFVSRLSGVAARQSS
jgi:TPR repeat protein